MARFERLSVSVPEWGAILEQFPDRNVFQSPGWISFLAETLPGEPLFAALKEGDTTLGYLSGLIVRKFGLKILGSPFRGWSTPYMGFNLMPSTPRRVAIEAVSDFALKNLGCMHFEVVDLQTSAVDVAELGVAGTFNHTMEIDLTQSEDELLAGMTKSCRWTVRKAEKNGVTIEQATDEAFAADYSSQLVDVFAKQGRTPHFGLARVRALIRHMHPTGNLLLLRARAPGGECIASGIYPGMAATAFYWGGASWRQYQKLYPNELLHWHALRYWKGRGAKTYNMVGIMDFKRKFGGQETSVPLITKSKYRWISRLRTAAPALAQKMMRIGWKLKGRATSEPLTSVNEPDA